MEIPKPSTHCTGADIKTALWILLENDMTRHDFQFREGLNEVKEQFDPQSTYIACAWNPHMWGPHACGVICQVQLPADALVYVTEYNLRVDKLYLGPPMKLADAPIDWLGVDQKSTVEALMKAIKPYGLAGFRFVKTQTPELCWAMLYEYGSDVLKSIKDQTPEMCLWAVNKWGGSLPAVHNQTREICLAAVRNHGCALQYVKIPTPEICAEAVHNNPIAVQYAHGQHLHFYTAVIQNNPKNFKYIDAKDQTPELCEQAVRLDPLMLQHVHNSTDALDQLATSLNPDAYKYTKKYKQEQMRLSMAHDLEYMRSQIEAERRRHLEQESRQLYMRIKATMHTHKIIKLKPSC